MIDQLNGIVTKKDITHAVIMVAGIGYKLNMSINGLQLLPEIGKETQVHAYLHVREDILDLYGFVDLKEREVFFLLNSISGIGPKLALTILSGIEPEILEKRITEGDVAALTNIPGVGAKTAKRIIIELKEKFTKLVDSSIGFVEPDDSSKSQIFRDVVDALISLGYKKNYAIKVCSDLEKSGELEGELETVIKKALSKFSL
ncbi:MAG: Holliday junction branch migration protein RuvA [Candidatus Marinimicrobia bacterium]|nr:Holliday junction branch migration protein RuvA [Candidatus Neomarinimicrobiota bacterium]|tara:strand:- start:260 stop:865 length:606 start_codon:yes stop_codon:yes gene_type:complete